MATLAWVGVFFVAFWVLAIGLFAICWCAELLHRRAERRRAAGELLRATGYRREVRV